MAVYPKPYQNTAQLLITLQQRGMLIADPVKAAHCLQRLGYYRLSGYWYPMRDSQPAPNPADKPTILDQFRPGSEFQTVIDLYVFDKRLRILMLDAIERIEVALRVAIGDHLGSRDPLAHLDPSQLDGKFVRDVKGSGKTGHQEWIAKYQSQITRSKADFVKHYALKYPHIDLPIWVGLEVWDFGTLSFLFSGMRFGDQRSVAQKFGQIRPQLLASWLRAINSIRNACAHHSRLWNAPLVEIPAAPKMEDDANLHHLIGNRLGQTRLYAAAAALQFLMRSVNPSSTWSSRLKNLQAEFPTTPDLDFYQSGFPHGWEALPLWN